MKEYNICDLVFLQRPKKDMPTKKEHRIIEIMKKDIEAVNSPIFTQKEKKALKARVYIVPLTAWIN